MFFRKPLTYAIALEQLGAELVHKYIGQEPSGRNFNELVLDENSNYHLFNYPQKHEKLNLMMISISEKPHNPMINAGAILMCALLKTLVKPEMTLAEKFDFVMEYFKVIY